MRGKDRAILNDNLGDGFYDFLLAAFTPTIARCEGAIYIAMSSSELDTLQQAFRAAGGKWSTFIIWAKNTFTLGHADYQRQFEPILYGWPEGGKRHWCGDRDQGDVWNIKKPHKNDLHPCLCPGTEVLTDNGWRMIESLVAGDCVLAADGKFHSVELVSSHAIEKPVIRLTVSGVESAVDATGNHPFLVLRDGSLAWIEAAQIIEGDEICSPAKAISENGTAIDYAWNTTSCGSETLVPSQTGIASITSTTTSKIITFQTCNLSPTLSTSGFTPVASCAMAFGGSTAVLAGYLNRSLPNNGISAQEAIPTDGVADPVKSRKSYSFVLRSVNAIKQINYSGLVWNLSVKDSPTFQTRIGMSHNTMKPVELVERAIRNSSRPGDTVLDPFGGSGTTLIAAEKTGRTARLIELDPKYVDVIVRRWQDYTGQQAHREADDCLFDALAAETATDASVIAR
ncbi:MAG: DNA methyltransferase, partial [Rhodocyclaceae bacterium]|nr:DNA methyltransferase [Rhodocyclaceae bacterium]